jgi:hypothetical protein
MRSGRWRSARMALAALLLANAVAGPARAAYPGTVAVNDTAFDPVCLGFEDAYPEKMTAAASRAFVALGYTSKTLTGVGFTRATYLARTPSDWGTYVHSHGDFYWHAVDRRAYSGFRDDGGSCQQAVVYSKDIAAKRAGRASNLVFISTCHNGEAATTLPAAFGIEKIKFPSGRWNGPKFYVSYLGSTWDSDQWQFEQAFWDAIGPGYGAGVAFDTAAAQLFGHANFAADWWGSYDYTGRAGPWTACSRCV